MNISLLRWWKGLNSGLYWFKEASKPRKSVLGGSYYGKEG